MTAPLEFDGRERRAVFVAALLVGLSRLLAVARTPAEWDEMLFCLAMRDYDVSLHHPHPPGFPLFVALARLARLVAPSDFRALQAVTVLSAIALFPALYLFARRIGFEHRVAFAGALTCALLPNVWFYGGTAFSDIPSVVFAIASGALVLGRPRWQYFTGALLLGCAIAIRSQNVFLAFPFLVACHRRRHNFAREVIVAAFLTTVVVAAAYGGAVVATGSYEPFRNAVRAHADYIASVDSFASASRPPLMNMAVHFIFRWSPTLKLGHVISAFALVGLVAGVRGKSRSVAYTLLTFAPFLLFAIAMLDRFSVTRFSIGYVPMFALLFAHGVAVTADATGRGSAVCATVIALTLTAAIFWIWPALVITRTEVSPPFAATRWVAQNVPRTEKLYVSEAMKPFVEYFLPQRKWEPVIDQRALLLPDQEPGVLLSEGRHGKRSLASFVREENTPLWRTSRRRYFTATVRPLTEPLRTEAVFRSETRGDRTIVTMAPDCLLELPPDPDADLVKIQLEVAKQTTPVNVLIDDSVIESFVPRGVQLLELRVPKAQSARRLRIAGDHAVDLYAISYGAARVR